MEKHTTVPAHFVIGDTLVLEIEGGEYPAPSWSLALVLISPGGKSSFTSTPDGTAHRLAIDTSSLGPGRYDYQLQASSEGYRYTIDSGSTLAKPDFSSTLASHDGRSHVKKVLDALEAVIEGRASKVQMTQTIFGVEIQYIPLSELVELRDKYRMKYSAERLAAGGGSSKIFKTIRSRFTS